MLAVLLAGVPHAIAEAVATEREHRCQCASHGARHVCACPVCRARAREARRDATKALPPCHRTAALAEVEQDERSERLPAPCLRPSCGVDGERAAAPTGGDAFVVPSRFALAHRDRRCAPGPVAAVPEDVVRAPARPPPRR
jgi:hypothetical protein